MQRAAVAPPTGSISPATTRIEPASGADGATRTRRRPTFDGRYATGALIGRGGSSSVYAARDLLLGRDVAVKVFTASADDPVELEAEEREARLLAGFDHRALTTVFDAGIDTTDRARPRVYLVMERMRGGDLRTRIDAGALSAQQIASLGGDLAKGLQHVHEQGLLHRDVKPANVLLAAVRPGGRLHGKLGDLGIASRIGTAQADSTLGTAAYLSPEQVAGGDASPASDVYALGLVLLEALTGVVEFPGDARESAQARLHRDARIPGHLPAPLASVLRSMLRRAPEDRAGLPAIIRAFDGFRTQPARSPGEVLDLRPADALEDAPDELFDRIAHLATRLLDVPIAFVALLDAEAIRIRSCLGIDLAGTVVPRDDALWTAPGAAQAPWAIADVHGEARLVSSAILVADPGLRAFAGVPLSTRDGRAIGSLGVLDRRTRDFTPQHLTDLGELARIVMRDHELRLSVRRALFPAARA